MKLKTALERAGICIGIVCFAYVIWFGFQMNEEKKLIGDVEVHVKYMGEWLTMGRKENVKDAHLGQAINVIATQIQKSIESAYFGNTDPRDHFAPGKIQSDGTLGPV